MSIRDKLTRFRPQLVGEQAPSPAAREVALGSDAPSPSRNIAHAEKWERLQASQAVFDDASVMVREVRYPLSHTHGAYTFAQFRDALPSWAKLGFDHPLSGAGTVPEDWLFFDTETTGLNGGTGNTIFLLGHCRVEGDALVVRQHFLPSPAAETALYRSFIQDIGGATRLVTFNGKSFDWPQVRTRHTLLRGATPALPTLIHHDLIHPARRLWRDELPSCRLSVIEAVKLGVRRTGDTPGHLAPLLYFEYLRSGDPDAIEGVLRHNEIDVLSLVTLYTHLSALVQRFPDIPDKGGASALELMQMARWHDALGQTDRAINGYQAVANRGNALSGEAKLALGYAFKRRKQWGLALDAWEQCTRELSHAPEDLYVELAKLCEHHLQDYEKALHYTRKAAASHGRKAAMLRRRTHPEATPNHHERRLARLERKLDHPFL